MKIRGILDNSLNGQLCIRGFAPIKELARISKADYSYQRSPIDRTDISDFLETQSYLFFPEIILGYKLRYKLISTSTSDNNPLSLIQSGGKFKSNVDNTTLIVKTVKGFTVNLKIAEIDLDDYELEQLINKGHQPLSRIDGNHRLRAAEESSSEKVNRMVAPFCIILGENIENNGDTLNDFDKATKVFFHNINTKTIPLTSEENLKVLIDDDICFSDEELRDIIGIEGVFVRKLIKKYDSNIFKGISHILKDHYRFYYLDVFKRLPPESKYTSSEVVDIVYESLQAVGQEYKRTPQLKANSCFGLLTAFLYYTIQGNSAKYELFKNWVLNNHIFDIDEIRADSIIKIFDKVAEQEIKVFVAMPYFNGDPEVVADYNAIYKGAINEIRDKYGIKISLFEIMNNKGATQDQIQDIINKIKQCSIFISDISDNNPNVLYETGWARALDKHVLLFREANSEKPKSDYSNDTYHLYKNSARSTTLKEITIKNIVEVLEKNFGLINQ